MRTPITWFVKNPVATNLMMMMFLAAGFIAYMNLNQEEFPDIEFGIVQISVPYLGATPAESEAAICLRIEEALEGTENIVPGLLRGDRFPLRESTSCSLHLPPAPGCCYG